MKEALQYLMNEVVLAEKFSKLKVPEGANHARWK